MQTNIVAGVVLAVLVFVWMLVVGYTGWYKDPNMAWAFFLVVPINIGVVIWMLQKTRDQGRRYLGQVGGSVVTGVVGALLVALGSYMFTTVLFPSYFDDIRAGHRAMLEAAQATPDVIQQELAAAEPSLNPQAQAQAGAIGTFVTTVFVAIIAGAFIRKREGAPEPMGGPS